MTSCTRTQAHMHTQIKHTLAHGLKLQFALSEAAGDGQRRVQITGLIGNKGVFALWQQLHNGAVRVKNNCISGDM